MLSSQPFTRSGPPAIQSSRFGAAPSVAFACVQDVRPIRDQEMIGRPSLIAVLAVACCAATCVCQKTNKTLFLGQSGSSENRAERYESWLSRYKSGRLTGAVSDHRQIQMAITIVSGDDLAPNAERASVSGPGYRTGGITTETFAVSTEGTVSMMRYTPGGAQGGGPSKLEDEGFRRLGALMADLPDDHSRLPPPGRRLVVQVASQTGILARVYDRANLPESILEMLRIVGADAGPIFPF